MLVEKFVTTNPQLEFDAVEFTGGVANGGEIMAWVRDGGGTAVWAGKVWPNERYAGMPEHVRVYNKNGASMFAYVGDYIMRYSNGDFKTSSKRNFEGRNFKVAQ